MEDKLEAGRLESWLGNLKGWIDQIEQFLIDLVSKSITWAAPLLPGLFIKSSLDTYFPQVAGLMLFGRLEASWIFVYVIEGLGLTTIANALQAWEDYQAAPEAERESRKLLRNVAIGAAGFYILVNLAIITFLKVFDTGIARGVATLLLSLLSAVAAIGTVMRVWQVRRLQAQRQAQREDRREKQEKEARQAAEEAQRKAEEQAETARARARQEALDQIEIDKERAKAELEIEAARAKLNAKIDKSRARQSDNHSDNENDKSDNGSGRTPTTRGKSEKVAKRQAEIINLLGQRSHTPEELQEALGVGIATIYRDIGELEEVGAIHKNSKGYASNAQSTQDQAFG